MQQPSLVRASARLCSQFGSQVVISAAASAVAAVLLAAPAMLSTPDGAAKTMLVQSEQSGWISPIAADGKIRDRHHDAVALVTSSERAPGQGLLTPAMIAMPMSVNWPESSFDERLVAEKAAPAPVRARIAELHVTAPQPVPVRKAAPVAERPKSAPVQLIVSASARPAPAAPALQTAALEESGPGPIGRVGDVMTSAVGTVGAAGIWTLSRASSLLPRL